MSWPTVSLGEVCKINPRQSRKLDDDEVVSFLGMADVSEAGTTSLGVDRRYGEVCKGYTSFEDGDVLLAKITPCFQNGKIAQARLNRLLGFGSTEFHVLRGDGKLDQRYLLHYLRRNQVLVDGERRMTGSGGQKRVPLHFLQELEIPLPPLPEQRRIAAILDRADALRAKRREAIARLDELAQAIYVEMFGDPALADKSATVPLGEIAKISSGSTPSRADYSFYGGTIPWIKTGEVVNDLITDTAEHVTEAGVKAARLNIYGPGAIVIAMYGQGATRGRVGLIGVPATTNQACAVVESSGEFLPEFMFDQLKFAYERLRSQGRGGNQPNLNGKLVAAFPVVLPTLEHQQEFLTKRAFVEALKERKTRQYEVFEAACAALESRAFRGVL